MRLYPENIHTSQKVNKALFLDRDGIVNIDYGYVHKKEEFVFVDGIFDLIKKAAFKNFIIILVTNQAGIGRGYFKLEDFKNLSLWMLDIFKQNNCFIHGIYYSPYHPIYGLGKYKKKEQTRKPGPGLLNMAKKDFNIDMGNSIIIGDKLSDIEAGFNANIKEKILLNNSKSDYSNDHDFYVVKNLMEATDLVTSV